MCPVELYSRLALSNRSQHWMTLGPLTLGLQILPPQPGLEHDILQELSCTLLGNSLHEPLVKTYSSTSAGSFQK